MMGLCCVRNSHCHIEHLFISELWLSNQIDVPHLYDIDICISVIKCCIYTRIYCNKFTAGSKDGLNIIATIRQNYCR